MHTGGAQGSALLRVLGVAHVGLYLGDVLDPIRLDAARDVDAPGPHLLDGGGDVVGGEAAREDEGCLGLHLDTHLGEI